MYKPSRSQLQAWEANAPWASSTRASGTSAGLASHVSEPGLGLGFRVWGLGFGV